MSASAKNREKDLVFNLMQNAANEQVSHLHDYQLEAIYQIMAERVPSLLASPAVISLFAHTVGSDEFAWGSQRKVEVKAKDFPGDVLYFISHANSYTIYQNRDAGLAYQRLFAYAQLAYLNYESFVSPRVKSSSTDNMSDGAAYILNDEGFTNEGRMNKRLMNFFKPSMNQVFHNRHFGSQVPAKVDKTRTAVLKELSQKYEFSDTSK